MTVQHDVASGADLRLLGVTKRFGAFTAVDDLTLTVPRGSFFALLGASGCGKTTTLRMIAGLEEPTSGQVLLGDRDVTALRPYKRPVNTVFQSYALFPHLSISDNVAFGLRRRGVKQHADQVEQMLRLVEMEGFGRRRPAQLSGGQQQRVALARALINRPQVLLLDEPLGALDLKLREDMQSELKALQQRLGITFVFVTHDQGEALTMSDRIAVFNAGRIEQVAAPAEVYERPATEFVAGFVGTSNLLRGDAARAVVGRAGVWSIRPEKIRLADPDSSVASGEGSALGTVQDVIYLGDATRFVVGLDSGGVLGVLQQNLSTTSTDVHDYRGRRVRLIWRTENEFAVGGTASSTAVAAREAPLVEREALR
jgi:putative spermidine/putrescine transport system ATP-binding protein